LWGRKNEKRRATSRNPRGFLRELGDILLAMMYLKCPEQRCDGAAKLNEIGDWCKVLAMADAGTLTVGCHKCTRVWLPDDQPSVAAAIRKYLAENDLSCP
jgi:hypothetical protein